MDLWSIVLAGGSGRRLQSVTEAFSGEPVPKQYCDFGRGRTLLQATLDRIAPLVPPARTIVVVDRSHHGRARAQLLDRDGIRIVEQPCDRGTAAGVLLPLLVLDTADSDSLVLLLPSDHAFGDEGAFRSGVREAERAVRRNAAPIVLLGVEAGEARSDYGWIALDGPAGGAMRPVRSFVEKPPGEEAEKLLRSGAVWNTMILVARTRALLDLFRLHLGELLGELQAGNVPPDGAAYRSLPVRDFSGDLLARASGLFAFAWSAGVRWSDLGTPDRLYRWLEESPAEAPA